MVVIRTPSYLGHLGKVIKNVSCVVMSVRVSADFLLKLQEKLGNGFECFDALDSLGK